VLAPALLTDCPTSSASVTSNNAAIPHRRVEAASAMPKHSSWPIVRPAVRADLSAVRNRAGRPGPASGAVEHCAAQSRAISASERAAIPERFGAR
jgi:hypothetical protein